MLAFLRGKIINKTENKLLIDVNGLGYEVLINSYIAGKLPSINSEGMVLTYLQVKEDSLTLFGFHNIETKNFFELLIGVSGIGPKLALGIIGAADINDIARAIITGNIDLLSKLPGIGKKTAQRLVLELKDKMNLDIGENISTNVIGHQEKNNTDEALEALLALGYQVQEAKLLIKDAIIEIGENYTIEELIRCALKKASLSRR